ncbi:MAG: hypothetical protein A2445_01140 [Candidatus Jacksonbacteria bacterium RIFOXYC2_FULL_44_29]|nr:MAG: hypothetical protein A2445_01140 [Candidatus Jacksonbacteria bacterium RIFOXYC2_FULL_44_29]
MRSKFFLIAISLFFLICPFNSTLAAPGKNQLAADYLKASEPNYWTTQALYKLGELPLSGDYLRSATCAEGDYAAVAVCAGPILGITALGSDPRIFASVNLVDNLVNFYNSEVTAGTITLNEAVLAILALRAAGEPADNQTIVAAKDYLLNNQNADGGWAFAVGFGSDTDVTAMAVMAMMEEGMTSDDPVLVKAINFIKTNQNDDGGFHGVWDNISNANSTAWVISMIYKIRQDPETVDWSQAGGSPVTFLNSLQTLDGWFEYQLGAGNFLPVDTTAQAGIALAGGYYPVRKITYSPPAPPALPAPLPSPGMILSFPSSGGSGGGSSQIQSPPPQPEPQKSNDKSVESNPQPNQEVSEVVSEPALTSIPVESTAEPVNQPKIIGQMLVFQNPNQNTLVKTANDQAVYLLEAGRKRWVPNELILKLRFGSTPIIIVEPTILDAIPEGLEVLYPDGVYLRSKETGRIYQLRGGKKYQIMTLAAWQRLVRTERISRLIQVEEADLVWYAWEKH